MLRHLFVLIHRYINLVLAVFLIIVSITGSLLAFNTELERFFAPQLFSKQISEQPRLSLSQLIEKASDLVDDAEITGVIFTEADQVKASYSSKTGNEAHKNYLRLLEVYLDPWTGNELGRRSRGDLNEGLINIMPFIYKIHWTLAIDSIGQFILGGVALLWTIDSFIGLYLTLPLSKTHFFSKWYKAFLIKKNSSFIRFNFDIHRSFGLWLWFFIIIFTWSSVMMNIRPVYESVMHLAFDYESPIERFKTIKTQKNDNPDLKWDDALAIAENLAEHESKTRGFKIIAPISLSYSKSAGSYSYGLRSSNDIFEYSPKGGNSSLMIDGNTGQLISFNQPTKMKLGNTIESWLYALHMARIIGMPYKIFVCFFGIAIVILTVTGIIIWHRKKYGKRKPIN